MEKYKRKIKEDYDYEYEKNNERFTIYIPISYVIVSLLLVGLIVFFNLFPLTAINELNTTTTLIQGKPLLFVAILILIIVSIICVAVLKYINDKKKEQ